LIVELIPLCGLSSFEAVSQGYSLKAVAKQMLGYEHGGGFSGDASVRIDAQNRAGLKRLLRFITTVHEHCNRF
jgi:hypothetical protein